MLEQIFGSKTRVKLLRVFFQNSDKNFYLRELGRLIGAQINAVRREMANLLAASIVVVVEDEAKDSHQQGLKRKYFRLNENGILNQDLESLLTKAKFFSEQNLIEQINKLGKIDYLLMSGRFVGVSDSPTDLLVVGEIGRRYYEDITKILRLCGRAGSSYQRGRRS